MRKSVRRWTLLLAMVAAQSVPSLSWAVSPSQYTKPRAEVDPPAKVVEVARQLAFSDFPKALDIITIARVESRFIANARNKRSHGIMQVNDGPWNLVANMKAGVKLLREYFELLGSERAAITAYNCGPSNYLKGKCGSKYFNLVVEQRKKYGSLVVLGESGTPQDSDLAADGGSGGSGSRSGCCALPDDHFEEGNQESTDGVLLRGESSAGDAGHQGEIGSSYAHD